MESWIWLIFSSIGLLLILIELFLGVNTGLDMVFIGSAFILGGLVTWPVHSWAVSLITTLGICILYLALGRRFVHRWTATRKERTNVDSMIDRKGFVLVNISPGVPGLVKVGNEEWRAISDTLIEKGEFIIVKSITGVTLNVEKVEGGK